MGIDFASDNDVMIVQIRCFQFKLYSLVKIGETMHESVSQPTYHLFGYLANNVLLRYRKNAVVIVYLKCMWTCLHTNSSLFKCLNTKQHT